MDMLVWNHISARLPDGSILITPGGMLWDEITPESISKSAYDNITADVIHRAVYNARPDVRAIVHLHPPNAVAVSCLKDGFRCLDQDSAAFYGRVANYDWQGISDSTEEEKDLAAAVTGKVPDCNTLLMRNHGFCTFGKSVAEAWVLAYNFERACGTLLRVLQTGAEVNEPDPSVWEHAHKQQFLPEFAPGVKEWPALVRLAAR
jgi:ribulose-5-phosphate 4-epimerase/fuculose-1-phosphate aldolase